MAYGGHLPQEKEDIVKRLNENLECSICIEQYKDPRVLNCQHSFCAQCLRQHVGDSHIIRCPLCNDESEVPVGGTDQLKSNFFIKGLIEDVIGEKSEFQKATRKCGSCVANNPAMSHCDDCNNDLCNDCVEIHKKLKIFSQHKVQPFSSEEDMKMQSDAIIQQIEHDIDSEVSSLKDKISLLRRKIAEIEINKDINLNKLQDCHRELLVKIDDYVKMMSTKISDNTAERLGDMPGELAACEQQLTTYKTFKQQGRIITNIQIARRIERCQELMTQLSDFQLGNREIVHQGENEDVVAAEFTAGEATLLQLKASLVVNLGYVRPLPSRQERQVEVRTDEIPSDMKNYILNVLHYGMDKMETHPTTKDLQFAILSYLRVELQTQYPALTWIIVVDHGSNSAISCKWSYTMTVVMGHTKFMFLANM